MTEKRLACPCSLKTQFQPIQTFYKLIQEMDDTDEHLAVLLGLVIALRVVDRDAEYSGQLLAHAVIQDVVNLAL